MPEQLGSQTATGEGEVGLAVRTLASPPAVLALVVLALNDHVLKQAWPGLVTGKLSDVAGLVFAPLLLAVPLAVLRVPRPTPVAVVLTGIGFALTKSSVAAAAVTSAVWSLSGIPTEMGADPWDLLTLPALAGAYWAARAVARRPVVVWRRVLALAVGTAVLPFGVLATAATDCAVPPDGIVSVVRAEGLFTGDPPGSEVRLVLTGADSVEATIDVDGTVRRGAPDLAWAKPARRFQCDPKDDLRCWRVMGDGVTIEASVDGRRTWATEVELTADELEELRTGEDGGFCGEERVRVEAVDLGVLPTSGEPLVAVGIARGGAFVRGPDATWTRWSLDELSEMSQGDLSERPPASQVTPLDEPSPPPVPDDPSPGQPRGELTCEDPIPHTVTPNPQNGPPTSYQVCPP